VTIYKQSSAQPSGAKQNWSGTSVHH